MPLSQFHPAVQNWFKAHFKAPSPPQAEGWPLIRSGRDTLICAPTGSGKTLTAFMACLDSLFRQGFEGTLRDETQIVYVSPLKALSNDIQKNLREPLEGIAAAAAEMGLLPPQIRVRVRTGDTPTAERLAMIKRPPHILVTTPESLFILLTAQKPREMLRTVRTVIIDEIHAVARDKRGAHLSLSLERLDALVRSTPPGQSDSLLDAEPRGNVQRIGLSATQRPVELVADFLIGDRGQAREAVAVNRESNETHGIHAAPQPSIARQDLVSIVNLGHLRRVELSLEIPNSPLEAVCSHETWGEVYERVTALIAQNRTTLIFVNTRRLCERLAAELSKRLGEDKVTSHHGSLSRAQRLKSEERLKSGELKALVATASLELGIDIGSVDLVCQIGNTSSIGTLLQRAGRSGHSLTGISRAKIFVLTREELMTGAALLSAIKRGYLDRLHIPEAPLDILAQQIVAASAGEEWNEDDLYALVRRSWNYRDLSRASFDQVVAMLAEGFSRRRGQKAALIRYDAVNRIISGRKGARLAAITSGGAIPDTGDYLVVQEPMGITVGTLNEDFAVESVPGDIFQLGNTSWKILKVEPGRVRVEDAHGQPPSVPFWLGEAPARSDELSQEVSRLREEIERRIGNGADLESAIAWTMDECDLERSAAEQLVMYLASSQKILGAIPTCGTLVLERFFDESGGMQLVLHSPFGRRINWGWGLALRKRFCRGFNFELQAAASENALLLSLGPQHSFPLEDVFRFLKPDSVEELLIQAMLDSPVFQTRWRWDASRSLALLRFSGGKKVPPALMRMRSDDLMAAVFPHAAACPENLDGDREIPDHPLVKEVVYDCLHEAMDVDGLRAVLRRIHDNTIRCVARDTTEPSLLAHEILTGKPYTFLDDAPLEERRTQAVFMRRGLERGDDAALGALDPAAIGRVRDEAWPSPQDPGETHDALMLHGYMLDAETHEWKEHLNALVASGRATRFNELWAATERVPLFQAVYPDVAPNPPVKVPELRAGTKTPGETPGLQPDAALLEIVRGRMEAIGPATVARLSDEMKLPASQLEQALIGLETQGVVLRGYFEIAPTRETNSGQSAPEWCDRRLLARIHRYTLERLRKEIEPVSAADYMRFLFSWQHASPSAVAEGPQGVREVVEQLQGYEIPAVAWERDIFPSRVKGYDRRWLDALSHSGDVTWGRRFPALPDPEKRHSGLLRLSPIGLYLREQLDAWLSLAPPLPPEETHLSSAARQVLTLLRQRGAVFFQNLARDTKRLPIEIETALGELVAFGFVTGDGFGGLRALLIPPSKRAKVNQKQRERMARRAARWNPLRGNPLFRTHPTLESQGQGAPGAQPGFSVLGAMQAAGRWSLFRNDPDLFAKAESSDVIETVARTLLRRWGVVFHRVLARENGLPPWRDILRVLRRMEARGEVRGGRFVAGFSGEQYALPQAVEQLRSIRRAPPDGALITISGADPLNLAGIITPGDRVAARSKSRVVFRDGVPVAVREGKEVRILERDAAPAVRAAINAALMRKAM
jgi:ATP-dependent Lhr-like helicase